MKTKHVAGVKDCVIFDRNGVLNLKETLELIKKEDSYFYAKDITPCLSEIKSLKKEGILRFIVAPIVALSTTAAAVVLMITTSPAFMLCLPFTGGSYFGLNHLFRRDHHIDYTEDYIDNDYRYFKGHTLGFWNYMNTTALENLINTISNHYGYSITPQVEFVTVEDEGFYGP